MVNKPSIATIIAGGRDLRDKSLVFETLDSINWVPNPLICGLAYGADYLGWEYNRTLSNNQVMPFPANWDKLGKSAGYIRNTQMGQVARKLNGRLVCFWDLQSKGTRMMMEIGQAMKIPTSVYIYDGKVQGELPELEPPKFYKDLRRQYG